MIKRRIKAFIESFYIVMMCRLWGYYDWEYAKGKPLKWWKGRLNLIIKDKNFIK